MHRGAICRPIEINGGRPHRLRNEATGLILHRDESSAKKGRIKPAQVAEKMAERAPPTPVMTAATLRETVPDALGDPENPLAEDAILAKARMLMESAGVTRAAAVIAAALALADGAPAAHLNDALP